MIKLLLNIKDLLLNTIFPIKCIGCQKKDNVLCDECIVKIRPAERETDQNIIALFDYRDPIIKKAIWELKYHHKRYIGERLGEILYENIIDEISNIKDGFINRSLYVIPVPTSKHKTRTRGYNQAFYIAKGFCSKADKNILEIQNDLVIKTKDTIPQAKITNRTQRLKNILGVFDVKNQDKIKGRTIIVIDDVTTTGGTINEIMKILKKYKANKVIALTIAH